MCVFIVRKEGEQSRESCALQTAETQVVRVLDGNRTLESAAFAGGKTALHHAAARGDEFLVRLLLERGCKLHLKVGGPIFDCIHATRRSSYGKSSRYFSF